jgi:hypothetical protein
MSKGCAKTIGPKTRNQAVRQRERKMQRFKSAGSAQRFLSRLLALPPRRIELRRFVPLADVRRIHQPRWPVEHGSNKLEAAVLKDALRGAIVGMVPSIDFREPRFMPCIFEHTSRRFRKRGLCPSKTLQDESLSRNSARLVYRPRAVARRNRRTHHCGDRIAPILSAMQPLVLDLGAQLLFYLSITEFAAGIDQRSDCGIAPRLYCKEADP